MWPLSDTDSFLFSEAHNIHGLHGLFIHLIVLLARDLNMAAAQEAITSEGFQKKLL